jgi:hypothetical protein
MLHRHKDPAPGTRRKRVSRVLMRAAGRPKDPDEISVGDMILGLGDRSFGWTMLLFALANMVPMPIGSTLITAIPLLIVTAQMALGYHHVRLPGFVTRRMVNRRGFQKVVLRFRPVIGPIERALRPRLPWLFRANAERLIGGALFAVAFALFLPMPGSGFIPATALLISSIGLIERDGYVLIAGLAVGAASIVITAIVTALLIAGAQALI